MLYFYINELSPLEIVNEFLIFQIFDILTGVIKTTPFK